jgi:hypothetical protein
MDLKMMPEFLNQETAQAFKKACEQTPFEAKLKRGLYLLKNGHYWEGI